MQLRSLQIPAGAVFAPMAGLTDAACRHLMADHGAAWTVSEMASAKALNFGDRKSLELLRDDHPHGLYAIQLFGAEPESMAKAVLFVKEKGIRFDILDINMGCPAPKITGSGAGSKLLLDPPLCGQMVAAARKALGEDTPLTVKMRIGWDDKNINVMEMAQLAQEAGVKAIAIHGRTREQFYRDHADWKIIGEVRQRMSIPVIANGDVRTVEDLDKIRQETGCEAVMVGRAAQGNPWIFRQLTEYLKTGRILPGPTLEERKQVIVRHLDMLLKFKGDYIGPREMRKHATWYTRGLKGSAELRCLFNQSVSRDDFLRILDKMK